MNMNEQMKESEESILHTYNRFPVVFERGEGVHLLILKAPNIWISQQELL